MNIVKQGNTVRVHGSEVTLLGRLEPKCYRYCASEMRGQWLEEVAPPTVGCAKVYGDHASRVDIAFETYGRKQGRNLGVILSGAKGIGKTLVSRLMVAKALEAGMPVLLVENDEPGLVEYIGKIDQDMLVLFDEFDKNFSFKSKEALNPADAQNHLLTLFDGIYSGHKLFVITCNEVDRLSDYLLNRPGRFRYHFRFSFPGEAEIRAYLHDNVGKGRLTEEDEGRIVRFASLVPVTYDILHAIADEIDMSRSFAEAMSVLNIVNLSKEMTFRVVARGEVNGKETTDYLDYREDIDLFTDVEQSLHWCVDATDPDSPTYSRFEIGYIHCSNLVVARHAKFDFAHNRFVLPAEHAGFSPYFDRLDGNKIDEKSPRTKLAKAYRLKQIEFEPTSDAYHDNRRIAFDVRAL